MTFQFIIVTCALYALNPCITWISPGFETRFECESHLQIMRGVIREEGRDQSHVMSVCREVDYQEVLEGRAWKSSMAMS